MALFKRGRLTPKGNRKRLRRINNRKKRSLFETPPIMLPKPIYSR